MRKYCYYCTRNGHGPIDVKESDAHCWNCQNSTFFQFLPPINHDKCPKWKPCHNNNRQPYERKQKTTISTPNNPYNNKLEINK